MTSTRVLPASHCTGAAGTSGPSPLPPSLGPVSGVLTASLLALPFPLPFAGGGGLLDTSASSGAGPLPSMSAVTAKMTGGVLFSAGLSRIKVLATPFFVSSSVRRRGS